MATPATKSLVSSFVVPRGSRLPCAAPRLEADDRQVLLDCACNAAKVNAVHAYLRVPFQDFVLRDFHAPTRLTQAGLPLPHAEHHVVSLAHEDILPYYVVLLNEFWAHRVEDIEACLQQWNLASELGAHRIIIVSMDGVSAL